MRVQMMLCIYVGAPIFLIMPIMIYGPKILLSFLRSLQESNPRQLMWHQRLLTQLQALDANYPGGLRQYTLNARELLLKSKHKLSSLEGFTAEIPQGFSLQAGSKEMVEAEKQGYAVMQSCAFVLLAGGLGAHIHKSTLKR